jgi:parallel beta-helix repeat protein
VRKSAFLLVLLLLVFSVLVTFSQIRTVKAENTIYIRADGTVEGTDKIQREGNAYTFTGDIYGRLEIQKSNIVLDGAGYALIKSELDFAINVGTAGDVPEPVGVSGITIMNLHIIGFNYGITLGGENNIVQRVNITDSQNGNGIPIWVSGSNHRIKNCRITDNKGFGMLIHATDVILSNNYISDNGNFGIRFYDRAATLRNNTLNNNRGGPFLIDERSIHNPGEPFEITSNDIDPSNMVDGKPVYYWVDEHDKSVPSYAGYVVLDNCTNISVNGLSINRNSTGRFYHRYSAISLIRTENCTVSNNSLNGTGIYISWSSQDILVFNNKITSGGIHSWGSNISIFENHISASEGDGISLGGRSNEIAKNTLTSCETGIDLQSDQNRVTQNNFVNCGTGISLFSSDNNDFHQNNFIDNAQHVSEQHYSLQWPLDTYYQSFNNTWNGNFWSDYNGTDIDGDGVGDTPYIIYEEYQDNYPLVEPHIIPEFPSWIILPLFLAATVSGIVVKKRLFRNRS